MSLLYDVYQHPEKGAWGVTVSGQTVKAVEVANRNFRESTLPAYKLAGEVSNRIQMGYVKAKRAKYLKVVTDDGGTARAEFVDLHPELSSIDGVVLFTTVKAGDDLQQVFQQWETLLEATDASPGDIEKWLLELRRARQYIVAPGTHPAFALVIADWAIENKRLLVGTESGIPATKPKQSPMEWQEWLKRSFGSTAKARAALEQLGWSLGDALLHSPVAVENKPDDGTAWGVDTSSFSF